MAEQGIHRGRVVIPPRTRRRPWPDLAVALSGEITRARLDPAAVARIEAEPNGRPMAIACSGGADSVALVLVLWALFPRMRGRWRILHFDHRLRGRNSTNDARFVERLAAALGEDCVVARWMDRPVDVSKITETAARSARQAFFATAMGENHARVLVLGHHANDVAESIFMRLARGSGTAGLCAPRPVHEHADGTVRVRPLLRLSARAIREALAQCGVPWREDATNMRPGCFRNRVRQRVVPAWEQASGREALAGAVQSRARLEEDDAALEAWLADLLPVIEPGAPLDLRPLRGKPRALHRRALHQWLAGTGMAEHLSRAAVDNLLECVLGGRATALSAGMARQVRFAAGVLSVEQAGAASGAAGGQAWAWNETARKWVGTDDHTVQFTTRRMTRTLFQAIVTGKPSPAREAFVDAGEFDARSLLVRTRQPGDRYQPLGCRGHRKLQDMFVDAKIPRDLRNRLPVVCAGEAILWVPGFPPAQDFAIHKNTKHVVQLTYL